MNPVHVPMHISEPDLVSIIPLARYRYGQHYLETGKIAIVPRSDAVIIVRRGKARMAGMAVQQTERTEKKTPPVSIRTEAHVPNPSPLPRLAADLAFPDLRPYFHHAVWETKPYSKGVLVGCDFTDKPDSDPIFKVYKHCGFWSIEETKILFFVARRIGGYWLDIGGLTGWTAAHLAAAGCYVASLDPMYSKPEFRARAVENLSACGYLSRVGLWPIPSNELFSRSTRIFSGIVIDGGHEAPQPLQDAIGAATRVSPKGVVLFHDANKPVAQKGCSHLSGLGWTVRYYDTAHGVALCHQGGFADLGETT